MPLHPIANLLRAGLIGKSIFPCVIRIFKQTLVLKPHCNNRLVFGGAEHHFETPQSVVHPSGDGRIRLCGRFAERYGGCGGLDV